MRSKSLLYTSTLTILMLFGGNAVADTCYDSFNNVFYYCNYNYGNYYYSSYPYYSYPRSGVYISVPIGGFSNQHFHRGFHGGFGGQRFHGGGFHPGFHGGGMRYHGGGGFHHR